MSRIVCDTPARAFVKNCKSYTGYFGCDQCDVEGVYCHKSVVFPTYGNSRSDASFRNKIQPEHHLGCSPFEIIDNLDMINCFPVDGMHLLYTGVTSKLLECIAQWAYSLQVE